MNTWSDIKTIYKLNIYISNGEKSTSIYANKAHQVPINIIIEARDAKNNSIILSNEEIYKHIKLVDYKNEAIPNSILEVSDKEGAYAYPIPKPITYSSAASSCLCYLSVPKVSESPLKVSVSVMVGDTEYTTSTINNNNNATPDFISLNIQPQRIFNNDDLDIVTKNESDFGGYNCVLKKYYVRFKTAQNTITHDALCDKGYWFHYKQTGNYKGCCTSTDSSIKRDVSATYTKKFTFSSSWSITVTSKNHEEMGICFWSYRVWHGALWSYSEWKKSLHFFLHDQYGNRADINVTSNGDNQISFNVIV